MADTLTADNRVLAYANRVQALLDNGRKPDGTLITADLGELEKSLALTPVEVFGYQNAQARAFATGKLSYAEAQTIYTAIGEGGDWAEGTDLALKLTITQLMGELLRVVR